MLNLTPHELKIQGEGNFMKYYPIHRLSNGSQFSLRVHMIPQTVVETLPNGVVVVSAPRVSSENSIEELVKLLGGAPPIIVSTMCTQILTQYPGAVYVPDTGPESAIRDADGQILAVRRLYRFKSADRV